MPESKILFMAQIGTCILNSAPIDCSAKIGHVLTLNQTDILVTATNGLLQGKVPRTYLPKTTVVQKEVKIYPSFPADNNPNAVTTACNKSCTLAMNKPIGKIRFMMCKENTACLFLSPQPC